MPKKIHLQTQKIANSLLSVSHLTFYTPDDLKELKLKTQKDIEKLKEGERQDSNLLSCG